jgi:hypothetical protein
MHIMDLKFLRLFVADKEEEPLKPMLMLKVQEEQLVLVEVGVYSR